MARKVNILIDQGATFIIDVQLLDEDGLPFIVTGCTATGQIRKHARANTSFAFTCLLSYGSLNLTMNAATTALLSDGMHVYDVELAEATGIVKRVMQGMVTVNGNVTRP